MTLNSRCAGLLLATVFPIAAVAQASADCALSYDLFEIGVPHTDMEVCPPAMDLEGAYCRLSLVAEVATVFAFSEETDCIVATQSFFSDEFLVSFQ